MFDWKSKLRPAPAGSTYKPVDPRQRFITNIDAQLMLYANDNADTKVRPTFDKSEPGKVRFSLKFGNAALDLRGDGADDHRCEVDASEFVAVLTAIKADAETGAFDAQLNALSEKMAAQLAKARTKAATASA